MKIEPHIRILVVGKTQSGKSYWAKKLLSQYKNRIVYDIKREYSDYGLIVKTIEELDEAIKSGCNKIVIQPLDLSSEYFDKVCEYIFSKLRNMVFIVDEVHNYISKSYIPMGFKRLVTVAEGKELRIGVISISQRPQNIHNDIISNCKLVVCFKLNLKNDAESISELTGMRVEDIQNLPYRDFMVYDDTAENEQVKKYGAI